MIDPVRNLLDTGLDCERTVRAEIPYVVYGLVMNTGLLERCYGTDSQIAIDFAPSVSPGQPDAAEDFGAVYFGGCRRMDFTSISADVGASGAETISCRVP